MLKTRIITAVVMVLPLILLQVVAPQPIPTLVGFLMYSIASWEWSKLVPGITQTGRVLITVCYAALLLIVAFMSHQISMGSNAYFGAAGVIVLAALAWWIVATVCVFLYPFKPPRWLIVVSGAMIVVPAFFVLSMVDPQNWWPERLLVLTFLLVWAADIGAYFVGKALGKHKLAPSVSPGKTWEGFAGGLVLALVIAAVLGHYYRLDLTLWLPIATLVVLASVIGDLTVSLFKRHAEVKDMGRLFPGHGGILDRFDSFSAAAPVLLALNTLFDAIPGL